jgi:hypothetical protein
MLVLVKINPVWIMEHVLYIFEVIYVDVKKDLVDGPVRLVNILYRVVYSSMNVVLIRFNSKNYWSDM